MSDLPVGWTNVALEDVVDILDSQRVPVNQREREKRPGSVPYYGATGQVGWIDEPLFDEELVLLGEDGAPFLDPFKPKAYIIDGPSWVNNHAHVLRAAPGLTTNRFLKYALDHVPYREYVNGTTRLKLTQKSMRAMRLPLPPPAEQERIVAAIEEYFSRLDAAEASFDRALRGAQCLSAALFESALAGPWRTVPLDDVLLSLQNGLFVSRPKIGPPGIPIYRISAVRPLALNVNNVRYAPEGLDGAEAYRVARHDLLFTRYSGNPSYVGACAVVPKTGVGVLHPDKLIRGVVDREQALPEWVALAVSSRSGRSEIEKRLKTTAGQVGIAGSQLKSVRIPLPPLEVQEQRLVKWREGSEHTARLRAALAGSSQRSQVLRRAVLAAAFSGLFVPQDSRDEPASALLDRIRSERALAKPEPRTRTPRCD